MKKGAIVIAISILLILNASASFKYYNDNLIKNYRAGETIRGKFNISLTGENANSAFTSNFPGNISLLGLLEDSGLSEGKDFECGTFNCNKKYAINGEAGSVGISGDKYIGFKITGDKIESINSISFDIESSLAESCGAPLLIDFLGKGDEAITSNVHKNDSCFANNYGCFDKTLESSKYANAIITDSDLCENIIVEPGPAYKVGANIKNSTKGKERLEMIAFDSNGNNLGNCELPIQINSEQELECIIEYSSPYKANLTICVRNKEYSKADYKIKAESQAPECGTSGKDFEIFAKPLKYDKVKMKIDNRLFNNFELENYVYQYLQDNYENQEGKVVCKPECIVPIKISGQQQNLILSNAEISYYDSGILFDNNKIYELSSEDSKITAKSIILDLEKAGFVIPIDSSANKFSLYLDGRSVFEEKITISKSFDFDLTPKFVLFGREVEFSAITSSNITKSKWDFGDGAIAESLNNKARHQYLKTGEFDLKAELTRKDNVVAIKTFKIIVGNPKESANLTLSDYTKRIANLSKQINAFPEWIKKEIDKSVALKESNNSLNKIGTEYESASSDEEYTNVMNQLIELNIPKSILISKSGKLPLAVGFENLDVKYIKEISKKDTEDDTKLKDRIIGWARANYNPDIGFEQISALRNNKDEILLSKFRITLNAKNAGGDYLIIDYPFESVVFSKDYGQKEVGGSGAYVPITSNTKEIEFLVREEISVEELSTYISPEISKLGIIDEKICLPGDERCETPYPIKWVLIWVGLILGSFLIVYIILQEWYKKNYEHHLFKNRDDLYNVINFIYNSRVAGLESKEIRHKLKGTGWKNEQITYAFKKIDGKRTGMFEIPIFKMFENRKVRRELEKRQNGMIDTRFIKMQGMGI